MAKTHLANVIIKNDTKNAMSDITVTHRFGDDNPEYLVWEEVLQPGNSSSSKTVTYKTGIGALTSYDWWIVTWKSDGKLCTSSPSILNYCAELFSKGAGIIATTGAAALAHAIAGETSEEAKKATSGTTLLVACVGVFLGTFLKRESKSEYKEFMLRSADAKDGVTITNNGERVVFTAASGKADTKYGETPIPPEVAAQLTQSATP